MKKFSLILGSFLFLTTLSCKKSTDGNKSVIVKDAVEESVSNDNGKLDSTFSAEKSVQSGNQTSEEKTYRYVAEDGSSALVTFKNNEKEHTISIRSNNKTITVPQKESTSKGSVYSDGDIEVKSEGDSVKISQGNAVISLKKARGQ